MLTRAIFLCLLTAARAQQDYSSFSVVGTICYPPDAVSLYGKIFAKLFQKRPTHTLDITQPLQLYEIEVSGVSSTNFHAWLVAILGLRIFLSRLLFYNLIIVRDAGKKLTYLSILPVLFTVLFHRCTLNRRRHQRKIKSQSPRSLLQRPANG